MECIWRLFGRPLQSEKMLVLVFSMEGVWMPLCVHGTICALDLYGGPP